MTVCYLEVDDEITGAIARIRAVKDGEAIIVVPAGSRIATSRINFKLLVREGNERRLNIVAVSDDSSARALAISAGLPAYDSLAAAEQGLANFREQDRRLAERLGRQPVGASSEASSTSVASSVASASTPASAATPASSAATQASSTGQRRRPSANEQTQILPAVAGPSRVGDSPPTRAAHRTRRVGAVPIIATAVLMLLLAGIGYGAYVLLPTATITLQPAAIQLNPSPFAVVADADVAVSDIDAGIVPAQLIEIPLRVTNVFTATGVETRETRAEGSVRFRSTNTLNDVPVQQGTVVSTGNGIEFETTAAAIVPRADFATSTPGTIDVAVRATRAGPRGNVAADAITELPAGLSGLLVTVRNPDPTDGGRRVEESVVTQADFDAALISLDELLEQALADALALPGTTPRGLTLYPTTAQTGQPLAIPNATDVVGLAQPTFSVAFESVATVVAVDETLVDELAEARLRASLQAGQLILGDEVRTTRSVGVAGSDTVAYQVAPTAAVYAEPDRVALTAAVRGKSIPDAQQILAAYGMVEITMWPEFVDRLPDQTARISLVVVTPSPRP